MEQRHIIALLSLSLMSFYSFTLICFAVSFAYDKHWKWVAMMLMLVLNVARLSLSLAYVERDILLFDMSVTSLIYYNISSLLLMIAALHIRKYVRRDSLAKEAVKFFKNKK